MRNKFIFVLIGGLLTATLLFGASCQGKAPQTTTSKPAAPATSTALKTYSKPPVMSIDTSKTYTATIETAKGNIVLELFAKDAPLTVNNFVFLARDGYYNGSMFHRVIPDFMAQGGAVPGTGFAELSYAFADEFSQRKHLTGTLSMANAGPNTNRCQFFITYAPQPHLDGKHSVFGQLTQGMDVLKRLTPGSLGDSGFIGDRIIKVTIEEK
ncbi:MAG: peptidylprolyl isomerase [Dehalococcoidales bacterium]|nr:peptidylprolyl isomerase [Dehalococcoidales bacterium]